VADRSTLNEEIVMSYRAVARALDRVVLPRLIELGLTMPQFKALIAVTSAGTNGISVTELGHELSIGQPSASLIVDQLVRPGYVERAHDTSDRRRVLVTATPLGLETTGELRHGRKSNFRAWLAGISDDEAVALEHGLRALAAAVLDSPLENVPAN
jgi:DNA-binding MarR family transcriptional regulator